MKHNLWKKCNFLVHVFQSRVSIVNSKISYYTYCKCMIMITDYHTHMEHIIALTFAVSNSMKLEMQIIRIPKTLQIEMSYFFSNLDAPKIPIFKFRHIRNSFQFNIVTWLTVFRQVLIRKALKCLWHQELKKLKYRRTALSFPGSRWEKLLRPCKKPKQSQQANSTSHSWLHLRSMGLSYDMFNASIWSASKFWENGHFFILDRNDWSFWIMYIYSI